MKTFQADIVKRFVTGKNYDEFVQDYKEARRRTYQVRQPSQNDQRIAQRFIACKSLSETAKAFPGVSTARVLGAISRVTAYQKAK